MQNLMLDLETLGLDYKAPIISIGAVFFDMKTGTTGAEFYMVVDVVSAAKNATIDADTVKWWMRQNTDAQAVFNDPNAQELGHALMRFSEFITDNCAEPNKMHLWGNGCNFDNVILRETYKANGLTAPWNPFNDRDVRTIVSLTEQLTGQNPRRLVDRVGTHHNALDDAKYQAQYVCEAARLLTNKLVN